MALILALSSISTWWNARSPASDPTVFQLIPLIILGDSHLQGPIGKTILESLSGQSIYFESVCGAILNTFFKSGTTHCGYKLLEPNGSQLTAKTGIASDIHNVLDAYPTNCLLLSFGTNYAPYFLPNIKHFSETPIQRDINNLTRSALDPRLKIFWLGPPDSRKFKSEVRSVERMLIAMTSRFEKSTQNTVKINYLSLINACPYPTFGGDGVHFNSNSFSSDCALQIKSYMDIVRRECAIHKKIF